MEGVRSHVCGLATHSKNRCADQGAQIRGSSPGGPRSIHGGPRSSHGVAQMTPEIDEIHGPKAAGTPEIHEIHGPKAAGTPQIDEIH